MSHAEHQRFSPLTLAAGEAQAQYQREAII